MTPPLNLVVEASGVTHKLEIVYDDYPKFCSHCSKLGHAIDSCYIKHPNLKSKGPEAVSKPSVEHVNPLVTANTASAAEVVSVTGNKETVQPSGTLDKDGFQPVRKK